MATQNDVRRIALSLPETFEEENHFAFSVLNKGKAKGIAWVWLERIEPKKARVPCPDVLAVRVANLGEKELLLASGEDKIFTEPHYNGYPAVLVRLAAIDTDELEALLTEAWRSAAPRALVAVFDETRGAPPREPPAPRQESAAAKNSATARNSAVKKSAAKKSAPKKSAPKKSAPRRKSAPRNERRK